MARDFVMGVHYQPKKIAARELQQWVVDTGREFYSPANVAARVGRAALRSRSLIVPTLVLLNSIRSRKTYYNFRVPGAA